ncbi:DgyrCDS9291 [Dimorphilus gyrociliatus]|uniref:DgyrCDS9291 n=1 Tax=Dimorphilus gyrociliatus TaxID=2664684 RepID=A0A7I8VWX0_9ANNE|nr:DgyrCDS9291 [Dimorphilus gyrociliatus]
MESNSFKTFIRIKPVDEAARRNAVINVHGNCIVYDGKAYTFSKIFTSNASQEEIFKYSSENFANNFLEGYNSAIFAYGKTGSGKTFTMLGDANQTFYQDFSLAGIIPRTVRYICRNMPANSASRKVQLSISFVEIYKENIYDLLVDAKVYNKIELRQEKTGVNIVGARKIDIRSEEDAEMPLLMGLSKRNMGETNMNATSSRSHAIFTMYLSIEETTEKGNKKSLSRFHLVDLAGSERISQTGATGTRMKEGIDINTSLTMLQAAINEINFGRIPSFRSNKLTYLLKDAFGGNAKAGVIACIHQDQRHNSDNKNTLDFAAKCSTIKNRAEKNESESLDAAKLQYLLLESKAKIKQLEAKLKNANIEAAAEVQDNKYNTSSLHNDDTEKFLRAMRLLKQSHQYIQVLDELNQMHKLNNDDLKKSFDDLQDQIENKKNDSNEKHESTRLQLMLKMRKNDDVIRKLRLRIEEVNAELNRFKAIDPYREARDEADFQELKKYYGEFESLDIPQSILNDYEELKTNAENLLAQTVGEYSAKIDEKNKIIEKLTQHRDMMSGILRKSTDVHRKYVHSFGPNSPYRITKVNLGSSPSCFDEELEIANDLVTWQKTIDELHEQLQQLMLKNVELEDNLEAERKLFQTDRSNYETKIKKIEEEKSSLENIEKDCRKTLTELQNHFNSLEQEKNSVIEKFTNKNNELLGEINSLDEKIDNQMIEVKELRNNIIEETRLKEEAFVECDKLKRNHMEVVGKLDQQRKDYENMKNMYMGNGDLLQAQLTDVKSQVTNLEKERERLYEELKKKEDLCWEYENKISDLKLSLEEMHNDIEITKKQLSVADDEKSCLIDENSHLQEKLDNFEKETKTFKETVERLVNQLEDSKADSKFLFEEMANRVQREAAIIEEKNQKIDSLKSSNAMQEQTIELKEDRILELEEMLRNSERRNKQLLSDRDALSEANRTTLHNLSDIREDNRIREVKKRRSVDSVVPVVGSADFALAVDESRAGKFRPYNPDIFQSRLTLNRVLGKKLFDSDDA